MCMKRDPDDCDRLVYPFPRFDFIDLTMDEIGSDGEVNIMDEILANGRNGMNDGGAVDDDEDEPMSDIWDSEYDVLPPMYHPLALNPADFLDDVDYRAPTRNNYISTNTNANTTQSASVNINVNIAETNGTDQSNEGREFQLNIPQILLAMSTVSNNLLGPPINFHN